MKRLLIFFWMLAGASFFSEAQECALVRETDPYTRSTGLSTGFHKWKGGALTLDASKSEIDWMIEVGAGNLCFDDESTIQVYFKGTKQKLLFRNSGTINCEGLLHVLFKNSPTTNYQLNKLATLPIERILVTNAADKSWALEPDAEQQDRWMRAAGCLVEESKKLLTQ